MYLDYFHDNCFCLTVFFAEFIIRNELLLVVLNILTFRMFLLTIFKSQFFSAESSPTKFYECENLVVHMF